MDTQIENIAESSPEIDLISAGSRGNSTTATKPESLAKPGVSDDQPICEVTVTYADEPDEAAVADILDMLRSANYTRSGIYKHQSANDGHAQRKLMAFLMPSFDIHTFWLLRHTNFYSYRKCVCPANRSHRAGYPFTSKPASSSHRRRVLVHIDSRERIACSSCSHRELHPGSTEKCILSRGEKKKEKALISQDFFGLVVATGLEPVTPSM